MPLLSRNGSTVATAQCMGRIIMGLDPSGALPTERVVVVTSAGALTVSVVPSAPGGNIVTNADVAVGIGATVALGAPGATARTMMIQNTATGSLVRIREVGAAAGSGVLLGYREAHIYSEAIETCAAENVGAIASTVGVQFETA